MKEYRLEVDLRVEGPKFPTVNTPKSVVCIPSHTITIATKLQSHNKILKVLAGSNWEKDKETLFVCCSDLSAED